jgi:hypothetical protein
MRRHLVTGSFVLTAALLLPLTASAQSVDIAGEWARRNHEDQPHRAPGADLGDYTGLPMNEAARVKAQSWDASVLSQPERQAQPHPAGYSMRGPGPNVRIQKVLDPYTAQLLAYTISGMFGRADRTIWMDGRPHPSEYAEHLWEGFSTGEWIPGGTLKVTTTHMKQGVIQRNGAAYSALATMVEFFSRHGDTLKLFTWVDDPVYLEEPMVRTSDFVVNPNQNVGARVQFDTVDELGDRPLGWVPHWPLGTQHRGFAALHGLPFEPTLGGKDTLYPEYMEKVKKMPIEKADAKTVTSGSN